jgi:hypothetical protein
MSNRVRWKVAESVKDDINNRTGKQNIFYKESNGNWYIDTDGSTVLMYFNSSTQADVAETLDEACTDLYSSNFAANSTEEIVSGVDKVQNTGVKDPDGMRARLIGTHCAVITKNTTQNLDWQIQQLNWLGVNKVSYMDGVEYKATDAYPGDKLKFQVVDVDGLVYPAGTVLEEFADIFVVSDEMVDIRLYKAKLIPGMYVRLQYVSHASATQNPTIVCNMFRHMNAEEDA